MAQRGYRALVTVLTKRMAEDLTEYLHEQGIRVRYMHSDIDTLERIEIIRDLRLGAFDVLVGINLLREGLDIPECALVAILDADKEGFLRSETSLIQTIGRAARNIDGRVILYADQVTGSMERAMAETNRRREKQAAYNAAQRHHAGEHQEVDRRHHVERLRARPRAGGRGRSRLRDEGADDRPQFRGDARRPREAHARRRRRPRFRGGRPPARRDQAPARDRARGGRRPDGEASLPGSRGGWRDRVGAALSRPHKPQLDEMGIALYHERQVHRPAGGGKKDRPRKPTLDEMGPGVEAVPERGPRSSLGRPGMHGGRKPGRRR